LPIGDAAQGNQLSQSDHISCHRPWKRRYRTINKWIHVYLHDIANSSKEHSL